MHLFICPYIPLMIDLLLYMQDLFIFGWICINLIAKSLLLHI
jgi:hypothetical protein